MAKIRFRKDKKVWIVDHIGPDGRRHQIQAGQRKTDAEKVLAALITEKAERKLLGPAASIKPIRFEDFAADYLKYAASNKRSSTAARDTDILKALKPVFGPQFVHEIVVRDVQRYKDDRSTKKAPATVNRELACLKNMFSRAIDWGHARENPVKAIKFHKLNNAIVRFLSPAEWTALIANCARRIRPVVEFALLTGMRKQEIFDLTWPNVDLERGDIHVIDSKNGEGRHLPVDGPLLQLLTEASRERKIADPRVFWDVENFRRLWEKALKDAGVLNFRFHDLRHTFASYAVMSGMDLKTLQELLGHKTMAMTLRYAHLAKSHKAQAIVRMATFAAAARNPNATAGGQAAVNR